MEISYSRSILHDLNSRELHSIKGRKRPLFTYGSSIDDRNDKPSCSRGVSSSHHGVSTPPLSLSFAKVDKSGCQLDLRLHTSDPPRFRFQTMKNAHILGVTDEEGYVNLFDTRLKLNSSATHQENAEKAIVSSWVAHDNSVYDMCWTKDDVRILTASADHTMKVWDVEQRKCCGVLKGHNGSVKSVCAHPTNSDLVLSGSRDGSFALWDLRCKPGKEWILLCKQVNGAHTSVKRKRSIKGKAASMTVTSVLYLKDEVSIATAGAVDSIIKVWDLRNLNGAAAQAYPYQEPITENGRAHGITNLSQDYNGVLLSASCTDNRIYLYNILQLDKGPLSSFTGGQIGSFFVKSTISPDASHILSGSADGNAYIWQVNDPQKAPVALKSHEKEVTAVDWCLNEPGKIATASDDYTVRFWNVHNRYCLSAKSPCVRRRVLRAPKPDYKEISVDSEISCSSSDIEIVQDARSTELMKTPETSSACQSKRHRVLAGVNLKYAFDKTPESVIRSPSSVLTPPSSLKRKTIRDYFINSIEKQKL